jgi:hypothetical protein
MTYPAHPPNAVARRSDSPISDAASALDSAAASILESYAGMSWFRAVIALVPVYGGSIDTLLAARGTRRGQERLQDFIESVSRRVGALEERTLDVAFLQSDQFFEVFEAAAAVAVRTASKRKREMAAGLLSGTIERAAISDLTLQIARDLQTLDEAHLQVLAFFADNPGLPVDPNIQPLPLVPIGLDVYRKILSDLERHGFIRYDNIMVGVLNGGPGQWVRTGYIDIFRRAVGTVR